MKNLKYILIPALTGLLFAACSTEPKGPTQAELDTQVEAKVKAATDELSADCNNRIMQAAQMQADSVIAKTSAKKATPKPVAAPTKPKPVKAPPTPPATIGNGKPKMGGNSNPNEVGSGKPKMGGTKDEKGKTDDTKIGNGKPKMGGGK